MTVSLGLLSVFAIGSFAQDRSAAIKEGERLDREQVKVEC